jgi:predicted Ser/Thr protein kinase
MNATRNVEELLARCRQMEGRGESFDPAELCRHCPDLLPELLLRLVVQGPAAPASLPAVPDLPPTIGAPAPAPDGLPARFGRYAVEGKIGQGGMGSVYLARDACLGRLVVLKVPRPGAAPARFLREALAAAALSHPNICPIHDIGEIDGRPFFCMGYVRGEPLSRLVAPDRPFEPERAAAVVRRIALAMQHAHDHGIIHRDLKPANVMLDERGEPVVLDFGLARRVTTLTDPLTQTTCGRPSTSWTAPRRVTTLTDPLTQPGEVMGTPAYMPPEQIDGDPGRVGPACDVYSLGAVLFELLTGGTPFRGNVLDLCWQALRSAPPAPSSRVPGLDPRLDEACLKALAKAPAERWPSMQALADALGELPRGQGRLVAGMPAPRVAGAGGLTLRVEGASLAYRPADGQGIVVVGRQRRPPEGPPDAGSDFVVRVESDRALSKRISRRHLEVVADAGRFLVIDRSKAGTLHNGRVLPKDVPVPLADGDRLTVAGVLVLRVVLGPPLTLKTVPGARAVASVAGSVVLEAAQGDLIELG